MKIFKLWVKVPLTVENKDAGAIEQFRLEKEIEAESFGFAVLMAKEEFPDQVISIQEGGYTVKLGSEPLTNEALDELCHVLADSEWK